MVRGCSKGERMRSKVGNWANKLVSLTYLPVRVLGVPSGFQGKHRPKEGVLLFSVRIRSIGANGPLAVPATAHAGRSVLRSLDI